MRRTRSPCQASPRSQHSDRPVCKPLAAPLSPKKVGSSPACYPEQRAENAQKPRRGEAFAFQAALAAGYQLPPADRFTADRLSTRPSPPKQKGSAIRLSPSPEQRSHVPPPQLNCPSGITGRSQPRVRRRIQPARYEIIGCVHPLAPAKDGPG